MRLSDGERKGGEGVYIDKERKANISVNVTVRRNKGSTVCYHYLYSHIKMTLEISLNIITINETKNKYYDDEQLLYIVL